MIEATNDSYRLPDKGILGDHAIYGAFNDWGRWEGTAYAGHFDLPPGDWVYVYPDWYVWESVDRAR